MHINSVEVREIVEKGATSPILLSFQNGNLLSQEGVKRTVEVEEDHTTKRQKIVVTYRNQSYEGTTTQSPGNARKFLCILDGNEVKMVEVGEASMMHSAYTTKHQVEEGGDYFSRNKELQKQFGGKRGQRRIERWEKIKRNTNTNETSLLATLDGVDVSGLDNSINQGVDASMAAFLPPIHRDATNPKEVYVLSELVGSDILKAIEDYSVAGLQELEKPCELVSSLMSSNVKMSSSEATALLYIDALVNFIRTKVPDLKRKQLSASSHIHSSILNTFCERGANNSFTRSSQMRDKAIAYCIALSFVAGELKFNLDYLAKDIGVSVKKLLVLCRAVGGWKAARGSSEVTLKLPLPALPTLSKRK